MGIQFISTPMEFPEAWTELSALLRVPTDLRLVAMYRLGYLPPEKQRPSIDWSSAHRKRCRSTCSAIAAIDRNGIPARARAEGGEVSRAPRVVALATAVPPNRLTQTEARAFARRRFADLHGIERLLPVFDNTGSPSGGSRRRSPGTNRITISREELAVSCTALRSDIRPRRRRSRAAASIAATWGRCFRFDHRCRDAEPRQPSRSDARLVARDRPRTDMGARLCRWSGRARARGRAVSRARSPSAAGRGGGVQCDVRAE